MNIRPANTPDSFRSSYRRQARLLLLLSGVGIAVFLAVAIAVTDGTVQASDESFLLGLRSDADPSVPNGPAWLLPAMKAVTTLGNGWFFTLVVVLAVAVLAWRRDWSAMWLLIAVSLGGFFLMLALKAGFARPRPVVVPWLIDTAEFSFPSGHAMMSAAIYVSLAVMLARGLRQRGARAALIAAAVLLSLLIGFTRTYIGVHYPSDVVAGWAIGAFWAGLCWLGASMWSARGGGGPVAPGEARGN